jgi:hypothetical protein
LITFGVAIFTEIAFPRVAIYFPLSLGWFVIILAGSDKL